MSLTPGTRLGPYDVTALLGVGGMGEVYRATDTKLGRDVAIKVLPTEVAQQPERLARFDREARALAALNHPNIAQIYGLEEAGGVKALVMELVEGPTLADRLARGAATLEEALPVAEQIAAALDAAHAQQIVHRDLKPANIKLRPDGTVKVLDFGLAKAMDPASPSGPAPRQAGGTALSQLPTLTSPAMTQLGVILGTAAYMAPEQASGGQVDKRADIWAFGVVLWEMLTGRRLFDGETVSHVLAAVLTREPDLTAVPPQVKALISRCLEKDPRRRLRDIGDAMSLVATTAGGPGQSFTAPTRRTWASVAGWAMAAAFLLALGVVWQMRPSTGPTRALTAARFQLPRPGDVYSRTASAFAVSPDGTSLAYYAVGADGVATLVVRTLATGEERQVPIASANAVPVAQSVFWSADSRQLVAGAGGGTQVFDLSSRSVRALCACRYVGGAWAPDGTVLLGAFGVGSGTGIPGGLSKLSAGSSTPTPATSVDDARGERDRFPAFLPDGRRYLFTRESRDGPATYVASLDGGLPTRVADGSRRAFVAGADGRSAYLLGIDAAGLVAQPFDTAALRTTGPPRLLVADAEWVSASTNGVLVTSRRASRPVTAPTWFDRAGVNRGTVGEPTALEALALSADGTKLVVSEAASVQGGGANLWLLDIATGARTRLTFNRGSTPVWSPDGTRVAFTSPRDGVNLPFQKAADGTGDERPLFEWMLNAWTNDWSRDGRWIVFSGSGQLGHAGNDLWAMRMDGQGEGTPVPYLAGTALEQQAQFSPDGRFVAYGSDQSGTWEIYVQPFPDASGGKWLVSSGGGTEPRWSRDGRELFYFSGQSMMAVPVRLEPTFSAGKPARLFDAPILPGYTADSHRWQLSPDGQRFLVLAVSDQGQQGTPLDVIVNWPALLPR
jgi:Tol biopolymer transport system component